MWIFGLLAYLSFLPLCLSLVFTDISPYNFAKEGQNGVRILVFDTDKQRIVALHYVANQNRRKPDAVAYTTDTLQVTFSGAVTIKKQEKDSAIITFGAIGKTGKKQTVWPVPKNPEETVIRLLTQTRKSISSKAVLPVHWSKQGVQEKRSFSSISPDISTNNQERGWIGERVTDLTFFSCGFQKKMVQNASNQGLDGIFFLEGNPVLFLTESKCRQESKQAQRYMESDLSEDRLIKRLGEIPDKKEQKNLMSQIRNNPEKIFKVVQRVLPSGQIESAIDPLDTVLFFYHLLENPALKPQEKLLLQEKFLAATLEKINVAPDTISAWVAVLIPSTHSEKQRV